MKKTIHVEIADVDFILNGEAYDLLKDYLDQLSSLFAGLDEKEEIISDIEARIAEKLFALSKKSSVVTHDHVHKILSKIGSPDEIYQVLGGFDLDQKPNVKPQLFRDPENAIIGGVCSGIGAYFGTDPVIVRIVFLIFILLGGAGVLVYALLWIIIPKADTPAKRRKMHGTKNILSRIDRGLNQIGEKLHLSKVSQTIEEKVSQPRRKKKG